MGSDCLQTHKSDFSGSEVSLLLGYCIFSHLIASNLQKAAASLVLDQNEVTKFEIVIKEDEGDRSTTNSQGYNIIVLKWLGVDFPRTIFWQGNQGWSVTHQGNPVHQENQVVVHFLAILKDSYLFYFVYGFLCIGEC